MFSSNLLSNFIPIYSSNICCLCFSLMEDEVVVEEDVGKGGRLGRQGRQDFWGFR